MIAFVMPAPALVVAKRGRILAVTFVTLLSADEIKQ
jgi:hypothetical protein